jgi:hypothetical protein
VNPLLTPSNVTLGESYGSRNERVTHRAAPPRRTKHRDGQRPDNQTPLAAARAMETAEGTTPPAPGGHVGQEPV